MVGSPEVSSEEFGFLSGARVGDFGSGAGHYTLPLSRLVGDEGRVYAVDINESSLSRLRNQGLSEGRRNINVILGNVEAENGTLIRDNFLDGVVFSNLLFHLENKPAAVREAWRALKPGGKLCLLEWSDNTPLQLTREKNKRDLVSRKKAESLFLNAGFHLEREFDAGVHHFGLIFIKP
jgi:ubiquinone/menaquinone biosynthesis C-methylase UbiE